MRYTFINENNEQVKVDIPDKFLRRTKKSLNCTTKEACELYLSDEGYIDNNVVQELTEKASVNKHNRGPARKEDPIKRALIQFLEWKLREGSICKDLGFDIDVSLRDINVINPERIIQFKIDNHTYELTLSRKRKV